MKASTLDNPKRIPAANFRFMLEEDLPDVLRLCEDFFKESDMSDFASFSRDGLENVLRLSLEHPIVCVMVFEVNAKIEGLISFTMEGTYTVEPLAMGYLFYVSPKFRKTPAGRILLEAAETEARNAGCAAFYMGAMAGIKSVEASLPNLFRKSGFEELPFWGRKIL